MVNHMLTINTPGFSQLTGCICSEHRPTSIMLQHKIKVKIKINAQKMYFNKFNQNHFTNVY